MIRVLALLVRRPDWTRDAFRTHYETVHAPLALPQLGGIPHYVRNHVAPGLDGRAAPFDVLSEFGYADSASVAALAKRLASPLGEPIRRDEQRFMDKPRNVFFPLEVAGRYGGEAAPGWLKLALLARAPAAVDRQSFVARHVRELQPLSGRALCGLTFRAVDGEQRAPYDAITFLRHSPDAIDADPLRGWAPGESEVLRLRVTEHVTRRSEDWEGGND